MTYEMEMTPLQVGARVAVLWRERDGSVGDLWEQLLAGSLDPDRGALPPGESWQTVFEQQEISLFQSIFGGYAKFGMGQSGYTLADSLLTNARASTTSSPELLTSIAHILTDIRVALGDGDSYPIPHHNVDLTQATSVRTRLLEPPNAASSPSVANSIEQLSQAVHRIREALGADETTDITSQIFFDPPLPIRIDGGDMSVQPTIADAFDNVNAVKFLLIERDFGVVARRLDRLEERVRALELR